MLEWLAMGRYAAFVWPAYAIALAGLAYILGAAWRAHRQAIKAAIEADEGKPQ